MSNRVQDITVDVGSYIYILSFNPNLEIDQTDGVLYSNPVEAILAAQRFMRAERNKGKICEAQLIRVKVEEISVFTINEAGL